jgi:hypothetical protein
MNRYTQAEIAAVRSLFIAHDLERYARWLSNQRADGDGGTIL